MAASEYLSTKSEGEGRNALKSSLSTGVAHVVTVVILITPYLVFANLILSPAVTLSLAVLIILVFNYHVSVAKDLPFGRRFLEMAGISLGVAVASFGGSGPRYLPRAQESPRIGSTLIGAPRPYTVPAIGSRMHLESGNVGLAFSRPSAGGALRIEVRRTAGGTEDATLLAEGGLLLHLAGRHQERLGWDEAELADDGRAIAARIRRDGFEIRTRATSAPDAQGFDIETALTARAEVRVVSLWHRLSFAPGADRDPNRSLDFAWIPNLCLRPHDIAGEHVFRSPCIIARQGCVQVALVPHLRPALYTEPLRHALRFRLEGEDLTGREPSLAARERAPHGGRRCPALEIGRVDQRPHDHVYYAPTGTAFTLKAGGELRLGFTLLADAGADTFGYRAVLRFIGKRWADPNFTGTILPQVLPFDEYAREGFASTLERYGLWREFAIGGAKTGGTCARIVRATLDAGSAPLPHDTTLKIAVSYLRTPTMSLRDKARLAASARRGVLPHVFFNLFLNNLRTAFGMDWYARRWHDEDLADKARLMRELVLSAPAPGGLVPSVFTADPRRPRWVPGTGVWRYTSAYHTANAAWTGCWMLHHVRHLEDDGRLLERCRSLADALVHAQLPSGAIPTFVRVRRDGSIRPVPPLIESASSAAPGVFLAMLHEHEREPRLLEAAKRVADFLVDRVFPHQAWHDVELYFSCSEKPVGWRDAWTGIPPQSTFPLAWTAELMRLVHRATRERRYLDHGRAALDLLLLFQQVWDAPFIGFDTRGGFASMNTDAEWSDARQAQFATLLMDWYDLTGEPELFHRGVAALRSSFTLMHLEEHRGLAPGNNRDAGGEDRGAVPENYGHTGRDVKIQGYVLPDWGTGSAVSSAALAQARWGDLYLDVPRGAAFGVDGCRVTRASVDADRADVGLETLPRGMRGSRGMPLTVKASGIAAARYALRISGRDVGTFDRADLERGIPLATT